MAVGSVAGTSGQSGLYMRGQGYQLDPATGQWYRPNAGGASSGLFGDPSNFTSANIKQGSDYDSIMAGYKDVLNNTVAPYQTPSDVTQSLGTLSDLSTTGGYSTSDVADMRERAISPVRSIYANAQANIERQKNLQGGYSPNYTAASAKLTRDESQQIDDAVINANASIAQNIAQNKIAAASPYASAASAEAGRQLQSGEFVPQLKATALEGMNKLYGTTPALTSMFGQQVAQAAQLGQGQQELNMRKQTADLSALPYLTRGFGG